MNKTSKLSTVVFSVYIFVAFYVLGAGVVNSLVAYKTWRAVGPNEFPAFHHIDSVWIIPLFVVFFVFSFIPQILLFWYRPNVIPRSLVFLALLCNLIALVSTVTIQIPIQLELDKRFSLELIDKLISTDLIYRKIPMLIMAIVNFAMLYKVVKQASSTNLSK